MNSISKDQALFEIAECTRHKDLDRFHMFRMKDVVLSFGDTDVLEVVKAYRQRYNEISGFKS